MNLKRKYYSLKRSIWALRKYFRIVTGMVPWDYASVLEMMKFQVTILADFIEHKGNEVDESRLPKIEKMRRFIELANNHLDDNFADRCGFDHNWEIVWKETKDKKLLQMDVPETDKQHKNNVQAIEKAYNLEEEEWTEMIELLKDMRGWWD